MKHNMKRIALYLVLTVFVFGVLTGCGKKADGNYYAPEAELKNEDSVTAEDANTSVGTTGQKENVEVKQNRKIIERIFFSVQTKEFDVLMDALYDEVEKAGGYIEESSVSGNSFEREENRYANLTLRIPTGESAAFTDFVSENSTVTRKEITTEDVTLSYVDMESRVSALETEKETLERLLKEATTMEDVLRIQDKLTDVISEIESYKSQLRTYDNLIDYTTITIRINEVERVDVVGEQTVWEEIGTNLKQGFENVGKGCVRFFVFIISSIPYILIVAAYAAVIIGVFVLIAKRSKKKKNGKKQKEET